MILGQDIERFSAEWWTAAAIATLLAIVIAVAVSLVIRRFVRRNRRKAQAAADDREGRRLRRVSTIVGLIGGVLIFVAWFVVVLVVLGSFGVDIAPLLASAGIVGVALGFGAQTLVRDTISGLFTILEGQYDVGDSVELETEGGRVVGTVEALSLRITSVRQYDGTLSIVANGLIQVTSNRTRGWGRAIVDLRVALDEEVERVRQIAEGIFEEISSKEPFASGLRSAPKVVGVTELTETAQVIRVVAETTPAKRFEIERALRESLTARMAAQGIKVPAAVPSRNERPGP
jgi:small conductance mechanosensitive channel